MNIKSALLIFVLISISFQTRADFSFSELKDVLIKTKASTVEEALQVLPDSYKKNYTLMRTSQSLQSSTPLKPRAILYGDTGKLIITFNDATAKYGSATLETIEFTGNETKFREILFSKQGEETGYEPDIEYKDSRLVISKPNPLKCVVCHTDNHSGVRPLWSPYSIWPNAYGENDDRIGDHDQLQEFTNYQKGRESSPRYRQLITLPESGVYPFYSNNIDRTLAVLPNARLNFLMSYWQAQTIAKTVEKSLPQTPEFKRNAPFWKARAYVEWCDFNDDMKLKVFNKYILGTEKQAHFSSLADATDLLPKIYLISDLLFGLPNEMVTMSVEPAYDSYATGIQSLNDGFTLSDMINDTLIVNSIQSTILNTYLHHYDSSKVGGDAFYGFFPNQIKDFSVLSYILAPAQGKEVYLSFKRQFCKEMSKDLKASNL